MGCLFRAELCALSPGPADAAKPSSWPWAPGPPGVSPHPFGLLAPHKVTPLPQYLLCMRKTGAHLGKGDEEELVVCVFHVVQGVLGAVLPHPLLVGLENKGCPQHGLGTPPNPP